MARITQISDNDRSILGVLERASRPLSAYDILAEVKSGSVRSPVQVYRSLEKLGREGLVHRIEALNAFVICDRDRHERRPGFVICRECGAVREFEDQRLQDISRSAPPAGFHVDKVSLEIFGHCLGCCPHPEQHAHEEAAAP